jgi:DNA-binding PadR family transcriptional regulator
MATIRKELTAASSVPLVLSILRRGESYGYDILREVKRLSGGELEWTDGMLYPVLRKLERDRLVASKWKTVPSGRRRRYYRLTARGRKTLEEHRRQWHLTWDTLQRAWETT